MDEKVLGLILYKQSPRTYKLLQKLFCLPSRVTIKKVLNKIPVSAGPDKLVFDWLKKNKHPEREKLCIIMFDEMNLQASVSFNVQTEQFEGFEDIRDKPTAHIANHVQVFTIKGIVSNWKQPLSFSFTKGPMNSIDLARLIKKHIMLCYDAGFHVIGSISDQGTNNSSAINYLMKTTTKEYKEDMKCYFVNGAKIQHLYDPSHLMKGIRNNLLKNNLIFGENNVVYTAKWADIQVAYKLDNASGELRAMPKLTDMHVDPAKIRNMKVSCATQIFSHTVASVMNLMRISGIAAATDGSKLTEETIGTSKMLSFFDSFFDSLNGSVKRSVKPLKGYIEAGSPHFEFWGNAKKVLKTMYFLDGNNKKRIPPRITNCIVALNGMEVIFKELPTNIRFIKGRWFNQDPLENFFCQMRQRGVRNTNPTTTMFKFHFRTFLINHIGSRHSISANCEIDANLVLTPPQVCIVENINDEVDKLIDMNIPALKSNYINKQVTGYVAGFLVRKLHTNIAHCDLCKKDIYADNASTERHSLILNKEYSGIIPRKLQYCHPYLIFHFFKMYNLILHILPLVLVKKDFFLILFKYLSIVIQFHFNCHIHSQELQEFCIKKFLSCFNWATGINRILNGKDSRSTMRNPIYKEAMQLCRRQT